MKSRLEGRFVDPVCNVEAAASTRNGSSTQRRVVLDSGAVRAVVFSSARQLPIVTALTALQSTMCVNGRRLLQRPEVLGERARAKHSERRQLRRRLG